MKEFSYYGGTNLKHDEVYRHVWQREMGNLIIVVIDDELNDAAPSNKNFKHFRDHQASFLCFAIRLVSGRTLEQLVFFHLRQIGRRQFRC